MNQCVRESFCKYKKLLKDIFKIKAMIERKIEIKGEFTLALFGPL